MRIQVLCNDFPLSKCTICNKADDSFEHKNFIMLQDNKVLIYKFLNKYFSCNEDSKSQNKKTERHCAQCSTSGVFYLSPQNNLMYSVPFSICYI